MKQTVDNAFFDSNIIVYCYTETEPEKQNKAFEIIDNCNRPFISTQVLQEFCNVIHKKKNSKKIDIETAIIEIENLFTIYENSVKTVRNANNIKSKYSLSFYDSLIISAALECKCNTLYLEDMQHGQRIENSINIVDPFKNS